MVAACVEEDSHVSVTANKLIGSSVTNSLSSVHLFLIELALMRASLVAEDRKGYRYSNRVVQIAIAP